LSRSESARNELNRIPSLISRYKQSVLGAAFHGELTADWRAENCVAPSPQPERPVKSELSPLYELPSSWRWRPLPELGSIDRGRSRHRPRNAPHLYGGPYPFVQTGDIKAARGLLTTFTQSYSEAGLAQSRLWAKGTVCITIAANIAETAVLGIDACFPDSIVGFVAAPT
jgi:type I restriction enzyme S subunit